MKVRRFYFVRSPKSDVVHRAAKRMEGDRTYCGITLRKGWFWWRATVKAQYCRRCDTAGAA